MGNKDVFVSYARNDRDVAKKIVAALESEGISCWFDTEDLLVGENWKIKIEDAIEKCKFFLCLLSNEYLDSKGFRHNEMRQAVEVAKSRPPSEVFILPVRIEESSKTYPELKSTHHFDLFKDWEEGMNRIVRTIQHYTKPAQISGLKVAPILASQDAYGNFIQEVYSKRFSTIREKSSLNIVLKQAVKVYSEIYNKNIEVGMWKHAEKVDFTLVSYIAGWIKDNIANRFIEKFNKFQLEVGILLELCDSKVDVDDYQDFISHIYKKHFREARRDADIRYIFQQAGKVYNEIDAYNNKIGLKRITKSLNDGYDHELAYLIAGWIKTYVDNYLVDEHSQDWLADGITKQIFAYLKAKKQRLDPKHGRDPRYNNLEDLYDEGGVKSIQEWPY